MSAPTKFLFDVDFARGADRSAEPTIALDEHALKVAEAENAAQGAAMPPPNPTPRSNPIAVSPRRWSASPTSLAAGNSSLKAIETRLECEAVEVAVAVGRKLAPALMAQEPFAEIAALAGNCFRQLVATPHIAVRVNDALYSTTQEKLEEIVRARGFEGRLVVLAESRTSRLATAASSGRMAASIATTPQPRPKSARRLRAMSRPPQLCQRKEMLRRSRMSDDGKVALPDLETA